MKILFDFLPIALFFIVYLLKGILAATGVAIAASVLLFIWIYLQGNKPNLMQWISVLVIIVFGGATLLLKDPIYVQWKPTIVYICMGSALLISHYGFKKNLLKLMLGEKLDAKIPTQVWSKINLLWVGFFFFMSIANLVVAYNFDINIWAYFKMFGTLGLTFVFIIFQSFYLAPYLQEATEEKPKDDNEKV